MDVSNTVNSKSRQAIFFGLGTLLLANSLFANKSFAETFYVTTAAVDSISCGAKSDPCRSISQAIKNAEQGDHIIVGPGTYGDINNDGDFDDDGEETAQLGSGCNCMVLINKPLTITSIVGARSTIISANGANIDVIKIVADNVAFGETRHGFTITGSNNITGPGNYPGAGLTAVGNYIKIIGNISKNNAGPGFSITGNEHIIMDNESISNATGFAFMHTDNGHVVEENMASNNGNGGGTGHGFSLYGNDYKVKNNMSTGNKGMGFVINAKNDFYFENNTSFGNTGQGIFKFDGAKIKSLKNNIFGNLDKDKLL